jgi:hypothetical protein
VVTAECGWQEYFDRELVGGPRAWHLVHSVPPQPGAREAAQDRCLAAGAGGLYLTRGKMPNPWDFLDPAVHRTTRSEVGE